MTKKPKRLTIGLAFGLVVLIFILVFVTHSKLPRNANSIPKVKYSLSGKGAAALNNPLAMAISNKGKVYVSDSGNNQIKVFEPGGKFSFAFGQPGRGDGQFNTPYGIGLLTDGSILVSDMLNYRIQHFDKDGKFLGIFLKQSSEIKPGNLMVLQNEVYVSDLAAHQVVVLNTQGQVLRKYTGGMDFPQGIGLLRDKLLVADAGNNVLRMFSPKGVPGEVFAKGTAFKLLRGIAVDNLHRVLVVDSMESHVKFLTENGDTLFTIGSQGSGPDQFMYPSGVAIDGYGNIYVSDWGNNRIQVWGY